MIIHERYRLFSIFFLNRQVWQIFSCFWREGGLRGVEYVTINISLNGKFVTMRGGGFENLVLFKESDGTSKFFSWCSVPKTLIKILI